MPERVTLEEGRRLLATSQGHQPEKVVLDQVRQYLRALGWYVVRIQQGMGAHKGVSDLICVRDGHVVFVECKTAKGKQSEHQKTFQREIEQRGGEYRIARCLEDVVDMRVSNARDMGGTPCEHAFERSVCDTRPRCVKCGVAQ